MFRSKRLKKKQLLEIWEKKQEDYFPLGYHWKLYNLIKEKPNISVKEICMAMPEYYEYKESEHNFTNCPAIYEDIDYLMNSPRIEKIIIKDNGRFRLGTKEECSEYAEKVFLKAKKLMAKYGAIVKRIRVDGMYKLLSTTGEVIDGKSLARPYVETYVNDRNVETKEVE